LLSYTVQILYIGIVLGSTYAVMAAGFTLVWGGLRFLNLAYGALFSLGAYAAYAFLAISGMPTIVAFPIAFLASGIVTAVMHLGVYKPLLRRKDEGTSTMIAGLGISLMIEALLRIGFTAREKSLPALAQGTIRLPGDVVAPYTSVIIVVSAIVIITLLSLFLSRSRAGLTIRALANEPSAAELVGINTSRITLVVMLIGGGLAGFSGVLLSSFYFVSLAAGFTALIKALVVTVIGGLGNIRGTLIAAYVVGIVEAVATIFLGSNWVLPVLYLGVIVFLALRPQGIGGKVTFDEA
jgi:branched-chain amino acid transport system permease protein